MDVRLAIERIPELKNVGHALIDFIEDICPRIIFQKQGRRWVGSENFVTFTIQHSKARSIAISLRGNPSEFPSFNELPLKAGMGYGAYTECTVKKPRQLPAVAMCIQRAYELYTKGSTRPRKKLEIKEQ